MKKNILVVWLWNFGYALLNYFDKNINYNKYNLYWWDRKKDLLLNLKVNKKHILFHKDYSISKNINFIDDLNFYLKNMDIVVLSITSNAITEFIKKNKNNFKENVFIINTAKAISENWKGFSEEFSNILVNKKYSYWIFSWWTIASDLFKWYPLWATLWLSDLKKTNIVFDIFNPKWNLFIETSDDLIWVEMSWIFKNLWSIISWYIHWKWYPYWTEIFYLTQFHKEIKKILLENFKINPSTFSLDSQCWWNDFILSSTGNTRNREFWKLLWRWIEYKDAISIMKLQNKTIEWINTLKYLNTFIKNIWINIEKYKVMKELVNLDKTWVLKFKF